MWLPPISHDDCILAEQPPSGIAGESAGNTRAQQQPLKRLQSVRRERCTVHPAGATLIMRSNACREIRLDFRRGLRAQRDRTFVAQQKSAEV
jgi:hypothetical protein